MINNCWFTLFCFSKVFNLKPSGDGEDGLLNMFKNQSDHNNVTKWVKGSSSAADHVDMIDSENVVKYAEKYLDPDLIDTVYRNVVGKKQQDSSVQILELLEYSMLFDKKIQKLMFEKRETSEFAKFISNIQKNDSDIKAGTDTLQTFSIEYPEQRDALYKLRKKMIRETQGKDFYISGTTLKDAFSTSANSESVSIIKEVLSNEKIENIYIFLLNYVYLDVETTDSASREVESTILNVIDNVVRKTGRCPKVNVILLSDYDLPFSMITGENLLSRSTHLFDYKRQYRGQYILFNSDSVEYQNLKSYYDMLAQNAYTIDYENSSKSKYLVKKRIQQNKGKLKSKNFGFKKIHPSQLENIVRASFYGDNQMNEKEYTIPMPDNTQNVILPYLKDTEKLLSKLVEEHDPNGWAKIIPSNDLGMPNNITRIAGGFLTGALYDWSCAVPIIPVDATVNTCTSAVFELKDFDIESLDNMKFQRIVEDLCAEAMKNGYAFSFNSGNHFLIIAEDDDGNYYLVLHCSAKQAKESCFGLYPTERVWYRDKIKTILNDDQSRYLRYIRGDAAVRFIDYANRFRDFNEELHTYVSEAFAKLTSSRISDFKILRHHYGMPTKSSIAIGTFVVDVQPNDPEELIIPVFSDLGKDICLFEVDGFNAEQKTYNLSETEKNVVLVPHGWGQVIDGMKGIGLSADHTHLEIQIENSSPYRLEIRPDNRIYIPEKRVRSFENVTSFLTNECSNVKGKVKKLLHPVYCYCAGTKINQEYKMKK